jgi:DNA processing protein
MMPQEAGRTARGVRATDSVRRARVWLSRAVEPGSSVVYRYVASLGPVEAVRRIRAGTAPTEVDRAAAGRRQIDAIDEDLANADRCGIRLLVPEDDEWPSYALLRMDSAVARGVPDLAPPLILWTRGAARLDHLVERSVAMVGTRAPTESGKWHARQLAHQLAQQGWTVISGGAQGIDTAAHTGALAANAPTVAVLAGGLDAPYPADNHRLFDRIAEDGLLLSEWPPGTAPQRHRFLLRNRLIAGLVAGTVVVEAGARSGASHTARRTRELGIPLMAVPGSATSAMSVGCHHLVRTGAARLVTNTSEILEEIGRLGDDLAEHPRAEETLVDKLDPISRRVLDGLPSSGQVGPEEIAKAAGIELLTVMRCLPALELLGLVRSRHGAWALARLPPRSARTTHAGQEEPEASAPDVTGPS